MSVKLGPGLEITLRSLERSFRNSDLEWLFEEYPELISGDPLSCIRALHTIMFNSVRELADEMLSRGCPSQCTDRKLLLHTFEYMREGLKTNPVISPDQFLSKGFTEHKLAIFVKLSDQVSLFLRASKVGPKKVFVPMRKRDTSDSAIVASPFQSYNTQLLDDVQSEVPSSFFDLQSYQWKQYQNAFSLEDSDEGIALEPGCKEHGNPEIYSPKSKNPELYSTRTSAESIQFNIKPADDFQLNDHSEQRVTEQDSSLSFGDALLGRLEERVTQKISDCCEKKIQLEIQKAFDLLTQKFAANFVQLTETVEARLTLMENRIRALEGLEKSREKEWVPHSGTVNRHR